MGRHLELSVADSQRFGLRIVRGHLGDDVPASEVLADFDELRADIAIFRCPAGCVRQVRGLVDAGMVPIHADTLLYYRYHLPDHKRQELPTQRDDPPITRRATREDLDAIAHIVRGAFSGYRNHYHANPRLDTGAILEGYVEWALEYIEGQHGRTTWVVSGDRGAVAFATCRENAQRGEVEIVLNAVDPAIQGSGLYTLLLQRLLDEYANAGFDGLLVSTQVWNYRVQRIWARCGLVLSHAFDTYHVNAPHAYRGNK